MEPLEPPLDPLLISVTKMMNVIIRKNAGKQGRDDSIKQLSIQPHPKRESIH